MIAKLCIYSGCDCLALEGKSYCQKHYIEKPKPFANAKRSSPWYNTSRWRTLKAKHLKDNNYCIACGAETDLSVDHRINADGDESLFFDESNLQTLCRTCHRKKTAQEIQDRKKQKEGTFFKPTN